MGAGPTEAIGNALANAPRVDVSDHGGGAFRISFDIEIDADIMATISDLAARDHHTVGAQVWHYVKNLRRAWLKPKAGDGTIHGIAERIVVE